LLLALKAEAEKAAAPPEPEERVIRDAPQRVSDFGPLALAPGRLKVRNQHLKEGHLGVAGFVEVVCIYTRARARTHTHFTIEGEGTWMERQGMSTVAT
jgi:hypothetical protein